MFVFYTNKGTNKRAKMLAYFVIFEARSVDIAHSVVDVIAKSENVFD